MPTPSGDHKPVGGDAPAPGLALAFTVEVQVRAPYVVGDTGSGYRRIFPIVGGRAFGPRLQAAVLPVGADWSHVRPDGVTEVYARYALLTDAGQVVDVVNAGLMHGLAADEPQPDDEEPLIFCRTSPHFAAPAALRWLNDETFVGVYSSGKDRAHEGDFTVRVAFYSVS